MNPQPDTLHAEVDAVERVARAIHEAMQRGEDLDWEDMPEGYQNVRRAQARAALAAAQPVEPAPRSRFEWAVVEGVRILMPVSEPDEREAPVRGARVVAVFPVANRGEDMVRAQQHAREFIDGILQRVPDAKVSDLRITFELQQPHRQWFAHLSYDTGRGPA